MKYIMIQPRDRQKIPKRITQFGPYLSLTHPAIGPRAADTMLWTLAAVDVTARLKPSSEAIGLNRTENPFQTNPPPKKAMMLQAKTVHQPKNTFGNRGILIKKPFLHDLNESAH